MVQISAPLIFLEFFVYSVKVIFFIVSHTLARHDSWLNSDWSSYDAEILMSNYGQGLLTFHLSPQLNGRYAPKQLGLLMIEVHQLEYGR